MKLNLSKIAGARSGDKGRHSNVGVYFYNEKIYCWAKSNLTKDVVKKYFHEVVKGEVVRYELDNIYALNFILKDSLGGGGSETLINDAQGKTHAQTLLTMKIEIPDNLLKEI